MTSSSWMWDATTLTIVGGSFVLAGMVKGVIGFGMPTVAVGLLTASIGLTPAMALMVLPTVVTNIWQGLTGGAFRAIMRRFWMLLVGACLGIWGGVAILARTDPALLSGLLGMMLCIYGGLGLRNIRFPPPVGRERWLSPLLGLVNGVLSGLTGTFVVPSMAYFQALALPRDLLVQTMGVLFTVSTLAIAVAFADRQLITGDVGLMSAAAVVPALLGMALGRQLRRHLSEPVFRRVLYASLLGLGLYLVGKTSVL